MVCCDSLQFSTYCGFCYQILPPTDTYVFQPIVSTEGQQKQDWELELPKHLSLQ